MRLQLQKNIGLVLGLLLLLALPLAQEAPWRGEPVILAVVAPLSGSDQSTQGQAMVDGIQLFVDTFNQRGGIDGQRPLQIQIYDDQDDPQQARRVAEEIVQHGKIVGVLGHLSNATSIAAAPIYKKQGIPVINASAMARAVTENNPWFFRTICDHDAQGQFLALYLNKVLGYDHASVIFSETVYGRELSEAFQDALFDLGVEGVQHWSFDPQDENLDEKLENILGDVGFADDLGMVLLAASEEEIAVLLKKMRPNWINPPIILPDSAGRRHFSERFSAEESGARLPGYHTDGILTVAPYLQDIGNALLQRVQQQFEARYHRQADRVALNYHDAAHIFGLALRSGHGSLGGVEAIRQQILRFLQERDTPREALMTSSGQIFFDLQGNAVKSIPVGLFKENQLVSAPVQLTPIPGKVVDRKAPDSVALHGVPMRKTRIVYTGAIIHEIKQIDLANHLFTLDFSLWFRYQGNLHPEQVVFLNATQPIVLGKPVKQSDHHGEHYALYRSDGTFKLDAFGREAEDIDYHVLGLSFRHEQLRRDQLVYVTDHRGMGSHDELFLTHLLQENQALNPQLGWKLDQARIFRGVSDQPILGDPQYVETSMKTLAYSTFHVGLWIKKQGFAVRRLMDDERAVNVLWGASLVFLMFLFIEKKSGWPLLTQVSWMGVGVALFFILLSGEIVVLTWLPWNQNGELSSTIVLGFDILWWIIPGLMISLFVERFFWRPLEQRSGQSIPRIVRAFSSFVIILLTLFGIIAFVFEEPLTSLLATSGLVAMIIGLAIQVNISNIFSGIAINMERPFRVGDWVHIGDFPEGQITDITWRTTRIRTFKNNILSIPNSMAAESHIENFSYPEPIYSLDLSIFVSMAQSPARISKLLTDAVLSCTEVNDLHPLIRYKGAYQWAAEYQIICKIDDYSRKFLCLDALRRRIWIHLQSAAITPALERQELRFLEKRHESSFADPLVRRKNALQRVELLGTLSSPLQDQLIRGLAAISVPVGRILVRQGDPGDSMFLIEEGAFRVSVLVEDAKGKNLKELSILGAGDFFGEMSLLTGEQRAADVQAISDGIVFEITREQLQPIVASHPDLGEVLGKIVAIRKRSLDAALETPDEQEENHTRLVSQLVERIKRSFR